MAEAVGVFKPGGNVPVFANTAIRAGRFVRVSGAQQSTGAYTAAECGAGGRAVGVAEYDSAPTTEPAHSVYRMVNIFRNGIARVVAGGAVTAGTGVESDAQGRAVTLASGVDLGTAMTAAAQAGDIIEVALK
jgi:hypothetical protein